MIDINSISVIGGVNIDISAKTEHNEIELSKITLPSNNNNIDLKINNNINPLLTTTNNNKQSVHNEKNKYVEPNNNEILNDIIQKTYKEGCSIYREILLQKDELKYNNKNTNDKNEICEKIHQKLLIKYQEYMITFPILIKIMLNLEIFHTKGYYEFLLYYYNRKSQSKSIEENVECNCKYIYYTYYCILFENNGINGRRKCSVDILKNKAREFEQKITSMMLSEYTNIIKTVKQNIEKETLNKKERLIEYINNNKAVNFLQKS
tara:strand:+ start:696 stop:1487 length:792 start_codon:yes stop_codon:yes gene_type:complete